MIQSRENACDKLLDKKTVKISPIRKISKTIEETEFGFLSITQRKRHIRDYN